MSLEHPVRVTLAGDRAGDYVVVEERQDGSLLIAPDASPRRAASRGVQGSVGGLLNSLRSGPTQGASSVAEALDGWGVELGASEVVHDFFAADVNGQSGFLAVTTDRIIFVVGTRGRLRVLREHPLGGAANVELLRRGLRSQLRISWDDAEMLIWGPDRGSLTRLQQHLQGR